jgi:glycosyltransferase involved in cell wall biosynthesis
MLDVFSKYHEAYPCSKFLILTGAPKFAADRIPEELIESIIVKTVPFQKVPQYLNTADIAFAIRQPSFSMQGVAPIKLGEYLLMGIPTIASKGIGDTEEILKGIPTCFIYDHRKEDQVDEVINGLKKLEDINRSLIREKALEFFSLEAAANSYIRALNKL